MCQFLFLMFGGKLFGFKNFSLNRCLTKLCCLKLMFIDLESSVAMQTEHIRPLCICNIQNCITLQILVVLVECIDLNVSEFQEDCKSEGG